MNKKPDSFKELSGIHCPKCNTEFQFGKTLQNEHQAHRKGDLMICSACATVSAFDDGGLIQLTQGDMEKLDKQSQLMIAAAIAAIRQSQDTKGDIIDLNGSVR
jgi:hypothetical protein